MFLAKHKTILFDKYYSNKQNGNKYFLTTPFFGGGGFSGGPIVKNLPATAGDAGLIPGSGRSLREGNGNQLQYSCLGNLMNRREESGGL